eukprot:Gb_27755 [translate_table: standard]
MDRDLSTPSKSTFAGNEEKIEGRVVLQKKNVLDLNDFNSGMLDNVSELLGRRVSLQLISATHVNPKSEIGHVGEAAFLQCWISTPDGAISGESVYGITFDWDSRAFGCPGAFFIKNMHHHQFFLKSLTLGIPGEGNIHFICNSWVYPATKYQSDRLFFSNKSYLPADTPPALLKLRQHELESLRGNGRGEREEWDRAYDYDFYNDLGEPDKDEKLSRPVLGGSKDFPYPRRCRTGRPPTKTDPATESRLPSISLNIFVPRDERFGHLKLSDFLADGIKSIVQFLLPELQSGFESTANEFDSFEDIMKLYKYGIKLPDSPTQDAAKDHISLELIKELITSRDGEKFLKYPYPQVIVADEFAWRKDEEFARQMLSGVNPVLIQRLQTFPPRSKLDPNKYGPRTSSIRAEDIEMNLDGLTVNQALHRNKLFILDHHDAYMPYLDRINALSTTKTYASRTILFLNNDGTLKPVAIELSLPPNSQGGVQSIFRRVFTPAQEGAQGALWQLAKTYVTINDSSYHQLISHWLKTHAVIEPFIIATNRQLSALHPIYKLLNPHFRDTMNINALGRHIVINAGGILERTVFPGKYSMEMSAAIYKDWRFDEEGLPADLLKRGMAVVDKTMPNGLRAVIEDYPYAVDGLEIWFAIASWVREYLSFYYKNNGAVKADKELREWWTEIRNVGHGDKKEENWWYKMETVEELEKSLTTIIWIASALHAAVNFGQYPYAGYVPNRPTMSRRFIPEEGSEEYTEFVKNPDLFLLKTLPNQMQATLGMGLIEILSRHSTDEVYLGQTTSQYWTHDKPVIKAFEQFASNLKEIERNISARNEDGKLRNRSGPAKVPYTLLYPNTSDVGGQGGLTGRGIPNSVSI